MKVVEDPAALRSVIKKWKVTEKVVGFVPTMGYLHEGHLSLMREAVSRADKVVASIFVNPRQFGPNEDLDKYPRSIESDKEMAEKAGVDLLFYPTEDTMYPAGYQTNISVPELAKGMCGTTRPGHFDGVATVVTKLFNLVEPDLAVFGQKDYQQLALIRQLTRDLNFSIEIIGHPIVREDSGLAMSSRNKYLSETARQQAPCLYRALQHGVNKIHLHSSYPANQLKDELRQIIEEAKGCTIDYISIIDAESLKPVTIAKKGDVLALAAYFDKNVRLIDNTRL